MGVGTGVAVGTGVRVGIAVGVAVGTEVGVSVGLCVLVRTDVSAEGCSVETADIVEGVASESD